MRPISRGITGKCERLPGTEIFRMTSEKHRLTTRADFDGAVCGDLLYEQELIEGCVS